MRRAIVNIIAMILSRRMLWRLGKSLYLKGRGDTGNDIQTNGEEFALRQTLSRFAGTSDKLVLFDVGANVGEWTRSVLDDSVELQMAEQVQIHSFEPVPSTFETLQSQVKAHRLGDMVHLMNQAVSSEEGTADMFVVGENAGTNSMYSAENTEAIQVEKTTIDAYCRKNGIQTIHYLKCDTEGHDMDVLRGASEMLEQERIMVFQFEYNHRWVLSRHYLKDAFDCAQGTRYTVGRITPDSMELYENWHPELERFFEANYVLIHKDALQWFSTHTGAFDSANTYVIK